MAKVAASRLYYGTSVVNQLYNVSKAILREVLETLCDNNFALCNLLLTLYEL